MFQITKVMEFHVYETEVKPGTACIHVSSTDSGDWSTPSPRLSLWCVFPPNYKVSRFYPKVPDFMEAVSGSEMKLGWKAHPKPRTLNPLTLTYGVSFSVDAMVMDAKRTLGDFTWTIAPSEVLEKALVTVRLGFRCRNPSPPKVTIGPIPARKRNAIFLVSDGEPRPMVDKTRMRGYGEVQTLVFDLPVAEHGVSCAAILEVLAWGPEELTLSGKIEFETEPSFFPFQVYLQDDLGVRLKGVQERTVLLYILPDLKLRCSLNLLRDRLNSFQSTVLA